MGSTTGSDIFGGITFIVIVALAVAAIAVMIYGRYLKQRRLAGEKDLIERREAAHVDAVVIEPEAPVESEPAPAAVVEESPAPEVAATPKPAPKLAAAPKAAAAPRAKAPAKAKAEPAPPPAAKGEPVAAPSPSTTDGDITQLKGLGPKLATTLAELGYTRLDQIASLTAAQASELDAKLGAFQGRMARDRWIEQATLLVAGDRDAYEAAFGKLG